MQKSGVAIILSVAVFLVLVTGLLWYFWPINLLFFSTSSSSSVLFTSNGTEHISFDKNFPYSSDFYEQTSNITSDSEILVTLSEDPADANVPFVENTQVVSGFSFPERTDTRKIKIYISPEKRANFDDLKYEINRNYLLAVLYGSEYQKYLDNPSYQPDYEGVLPLMNKIVKQARETQQYPVVLQL